MPEVRPIDANAFIADLKDEAVNLYLNGLKGTPRDYKFLYDIADRVGEQPTLTDYEPVIHAHWEDGAFENSKRCSACKRYASKVHSLSEPVFDYERCPYCGAHMDAKEDDNA